MYMIPLLKYSIPESPFPHPRSGGHTPFHFPLQSLMAGRVMSRG